MTSNDDVADSTDWLATSLSSFAPLDAALRCQVCKDFYDTPMITSCSHTFCSLCIRRCLSSDGQCPICRMADQSSKLRRNWTVQELVEAFQTARPEALKLVREKVTFTAEDEIPTGHKRKLANTELSEEESTRNTRARQTRSQSQRDENQSRPAPQFVINLDSEGDSYNEKPPEVETPKDGLVACPLCCTRMKEEQVFPHLDQCDGDPKLESKSRKTRTPPPKQHLQRPLPQNLSPTKQLPHLNYSLLKDNPLKKRLQELGIPVWGSRQLLIRRHTQWVDIFNANSDSPRPRSMREMLRELDTWERTQGGHAQGQGQNGPTGVMKKDFDGHEWIGKHKSQFDDLIANARAKIIKPQRDEMEETKEAPIDANTSTPLDSSATLHTKSVAGNEESIAIRPLVSAESMVLQVPVPVFSSSTVNELPVHFPTPPKSCSEHLSLDITSVSQPSPSMQGHFASAQSNSESLEETSFPSDHVADLVEYNVEGVGDGQN